MARILIAEDEDAVRALVARALMEAGHDVQVSADGGEAAEALQHDTRGFDLLLTDIRMPVMDGIALALIAARDFPAMPVILMTGYADQRERASGLDAIVRDILTKPFTLAQIRSAVAAALAH